MLWGGRQLSALLQESTDAFEHIEVRLIERLSDARISGDDSQQAIAVDEWRGDGTAKARLKQACDVQQIE